ncbi:MFS transporter [Virgibacillus chiguensis]|uniref:MFS transporter, ACDE family, multidrug resistance protein n=1 Tax=Virgibacillus chiguensis TaxID=411959 RepID=A0A1M5X4Z3_9BACI|nr:MFS transporter [Virgibacillus chiguensis]SHH94877.1 MFS transporter, ACDE family, multidrug resistance protein [Virgibacillus chiguensis]
MTNQPKTWSIISIASIPLVMTLGNSMLIPVLPIFEKEVGITSFQSSMVITSYSIAAIFLIPVAGYLSDRYSRKIVILISLIFAFIGGLIAGFASWKLTEPFTWIIIGRILQGIGAAGAFPIVLPLVGDLFKGDDEKTSACLGIVETSNTLGKVLSPILGALFAAFLWYIPFFSISVFSIISTVLIYFFIKVPKQADEVEPLRKFIQRTKNTFKTEGKWLYTVFLIGIHFMLILFGVLFFLSDIFEKQHQLFGVTKGFVLAIPLFGLCLASFITGRKIKGDLATMKRVLLVSLPIVAVTVVFIGFSSNNLYLLLSVSSILGIAIGAVLPTLDALITQGIDKEERGTITAFYSSSRFIGVALGPPVISLAMRHYIHFSYITMGIVSFLLVFFVWFFIRGEEAIIAESG